MSRWTLVFAAAGLFGAPLRADSYFAVRVFGELSAPGHARSAAMGGTDAAECGPEGPRRTLSLSGAAAGTRQMWTESASQTRLADTERWALRDARLSVPFGRGRWRWTAFAAPGMDFHARSSRRIYNSTGVPSGEERLNGSGTLWTIGGGLTVPLGRGSSCRLDLYQAFGREFLRMGKYPLNGPPSRDLKESARYSGMSGRVAVRLRTSKSMEIGAAYQPAMEVKRRRVLTDGPAARVEGGRDKWVLPPHTLLGLNFRPGGGQDVRLAVEVKHTFWREASVNGKPPSGLEALKPVFREVFRSTDVAVPPAVSSLRLRATTEIGVGVDQRLGERWSLQYGFRHQPFYADRRAETTSFSLGAGHQVGERWRWFISGTLAKRDFIGDGVFYPAGWRIEETARTVSLTLERSW